MRMTSVGASHSSPFSKVSFSNVLVAETLSSLQDPSQVTVDQLVSGSPDKSKQMSISSTWEANWGRIPTNTSWATDSFSLPLSGLLASFGSIFEGFHFGVKRNSLHASTAFNVMLWEPQDLTGLWPKTWKCLTLKLDKSLKFPRDIYGTNSHITTTIDFWAFIALKFIAFIKDSIPNSKLTIESIQT